MDDTQGDLRPQDTTDGPEHKPSGELGGHPVNADETAPARAHARRGPDERLARRGRGQPHAGRGRRRAGSDL